MAMGRQKKEQQDDIWVATTQLVQTPSHPFYERLESLLAQHGFEAMLEGECAQYYARVMGRPSMPPVVYFKLLLIGFFEGIDSERGIAWRVADSMALRSFLGYRLTEATPDHSTLSRTRRLMSVETHRQVFQWVLRVLAQEGLLEGKTLGVDSTTLEANAALRSIVRRDTGETYNEFLTALAQASGIETPTLEELKKLDRNRPKKGSNKEWRHPHDPDSRIAKMKDGRTHLAHKAEHAVDMETGAVVSVTVQGADQGDTETVQKTLEEAEQNLAAAKEEPPASPDASAEDSAAPPAPRKEVVLDKGYHSDATLLTLTGGGWRIYASEPKRGRRRWQGKPAGTQEAVYANHRRIEGHRGKRLLRRRGELVERSFAHGYETGGMRRTHLRGHPNILKRILIHMGGFNLSLVLRKHLGAGKPRHLCDYLMKDLKDKTQQGTKRIFDAFRGLWSRRVTAYSPLRGSLSSLTPTQRKKKNIMTQFEKLTFTTGC